MVKARTTYLLDYSISSKVLPRMWPVSVALSLPLCAGDILVLPDCASATKPISHFRRQGLLLPWDVLTNVSIQLYILAHSFPTWLSVVNGKDSNVRLLGHVALSRGWGSLLAPWN